MDIDHRIDEADLVEKMARAICRTDGVDPNHLCGGLGVKIPKGEEWPAWQVRMSQAEACLDVLRAEGIITQANLRRREHP